MGNILKYPAEFEEQSKILFAFPSIKSDWSCCYEDFKLSLIYFIKQVSIYQEVLVVCHDKQLVSNYFNGYNNLEFFEYELNDSWIRDFGVITVYENNVIKLLDFTFNAWGNKFDSTQDNNLNKVLFKESKTIDFILEGGSIESNSKGLILTTSNCLLNQNRNTKLSKIEIEDKLKKYLGTNRVLWLDSGFLEGDDTDSHIDTLVRFVDSSTVMYITCDDKNDKHYSELKSMEKELQNFHEIKELIPLPFVSAKYYKNQRLPATYANFLITNSAVFVPIYEDKNDNLALKIIGDFFFDKKVVAIPSSVFIRQGGSIHCLSIQLY